HALKAVLFCKLRREVDVLEFTTFLQPFFCSPAPQYRRTWASIPRLQTDTGYIGLASLVDGCGCRAPAIPRQVHSLLSPSLSLPWSEHNVHSFPPQSLCSSFGVNNCSVICYAFLYSSHTKSTKKGKESCGISQQRPSRFQKLAPG